MDRSVWEQVKTLFQEAVQLDPAQREDWLATHCPATPEVGDELRALLSAHDEAARAAQPAGAGEGPAGGQIGRYRLLQQIGEGGFGTVHLAEQLEPVHRQVALKVLKPGMDSQAVIARFAAERQALASMNHPAIAQVYDAGTTERGQPFFAMEYVPGEPITTYCEHHGLALEPRLLLFLDVCRGVHHAHQKGVIHRDLKPSNVLVATVDGRPGPKIIDFGIAKATQPGDHSRERTVEGRFLGTPAYMSPEQADFAGHSVDTRSDVYSLGVILYELLTGQLPFDPAAHRDQGFLDFLRAVRETEPQRPSSKLLRGDAGRNTAARALRGDLDWITLRALEKDPERRYQSVFGLVADLERHLQDQPVAAGPPGLAYRLHKAVRRNRTAAVTVAAVFVSLVAGLLVSLHQIRVAAAALRLAVGHRLSAQSIAMTAEDPTLALLLAIEGAERAPGEDANTALFAALDHGHELAQWNRHDLSVRQVALRADGKRILSADDSRLVLLWDADRGDVLQRFDVHDQIVTSVGFLGDGRVGWTASADGTLRLWELETGLPRHVCAHPAAVTVTIASADGRSLFTGCADGKVRRIDVATGGLRVIARHPQAVVSLSASKDGEHLASLDASLEVCVSDPRGDANPRRIALDTTAPPPIYNVDIYHAPVVQLSPDGRLLLARATSGDCAVFDAGSGARVWQLTAEDEFGGFALFDPSGQRLFLHRLSRRGDDPRAEVFDVATHQRLCTLLGAEISTHLAATFDADGHTLVLSGHAYDDLFDAITGRHLGSMLGDPHSLYSPCFFPGGDKLVTGGHDGRLRLWAVSPYREWRHLEQLQSRGQLQFLAAAADGRTAVVQRLLPGPTAGPIEWLDTETTATARQLLPAGPGNASSVYSADGRLVAACAGGRLVVIDPAAGRTLLDLAGSASALRFNATGTFLCGVRDNRAVVWDLQHGGETTFPPDAIRCDVSPDGAYVACANANQNTTSIWRRGELQPLRVIEHNGFCFDARFSPDGSRLYTFANDTSLLVIDTTTFARVGQLTVPTADNGFLQVSPDGRWLALSIYTGLMVYDAATLQRLCNRPDGSFEALGFHADGRHLLVMRRDGLLRLLPLEPLASARRLLPRQLTGAEMTRFDIGSRAEQESRALAELEQPMPARRLVELAEQAIAAGHLAAAADWLARAAATRPRPPARFHFATALVHAAQAAVRTGTARETEAAAAVAALRRFVAAGTADRAVLETAPAFALLQKRADFQALLERLK